MRFIRFLLLNSFLFSNFVHSQPILKKSEIIRKSNNCFENLEYEVCKNIILQTEKMQLIEFEKNRYKCQSSILGLQTELVEAFYFKKTKKKQKRIMIPYVNKNC